MANSVDPDQTVPGFTLFAHAILSELLVYKIIGQLSFLGLYQIFCICLSHIFTHMPKSHFYTYPGESK